VLVGELVTALGNELCKTIMRNADRAEDETAAFKMTFNCAWLAFTRERERERERERNSCIL
jgi:hypothetical protein